jgi:spore maturation protein CgeB
MMEKIMYYLANDEVRKRAAFAGHQRVIEAGHDVVSRMRQLITWVEGMKGAAF